MRSDHFTRLGILFLLVFISCEKELPLDIPQSEPMMVVEGWIEQNRSAKIILTQSIPFFSSIDSGSLRNLALTNAKIVLTYEDKTEVLTLKRNDQYFPPIVYTSTEIKGSENKRYTLTIIYKKDTITAATTIPKPLELDSIWFKYEEGNDTSGRVWIKFTDDPSEANYYRIFMQRVGKDKRYIPAYISTISDKIFNGETITVGLLRGAGSIIEVGENRYFTKGDTINVKFCTIDKAHFDFWDSVQSKIITSANPFSASNARVKSNVSKGFGIWGGYGATYYQVIAK